MTLGQLRDRVVYFLATMPEYPAANDICYIKIGISRDVPGRIRKLQVGCPTPIKLLGTYKTIPWGARRIENELHKILGEWRILGEWFLGEPTVFSHIRFILNEPGGRWSPEFQPKTLF